MSFDSQRTTTDYITWIKNEFLPLQLATPDTALEQILENTIRYLNTHSAFKISQNIEYTHGLVRTQVSEKIKTVVSVVPNKINQYNWNTHPLFTLTGVAILDNVTTDMILTSTSYNDLKAFVGADFDWTFERSTDPSEGGYLYCRNVPAEASRVYIIGTRRITSTEDIDDEFIIDWVLRYFRALVKIQEGNTLRKAGIIGVNNDGNQLLSEGRSEKKELEEELAINSRWVCMIQRK